MKKMRICLRVNLFREKYELVAASPGLRSVKLGRTGWHRQTQSTKAQRRSQEWAGGGAASRARGQWGLMLTEPLDRLTRTWILFWTRFLNSLMEIKQWSDMIWLLFKRSLWLSCEEPALQEDTNGRRLRGCSLNPGRADGKDWFHWTSLKPCFKTLFLWISMCA